MAIFDLHLTDEFFWKLTPIEFDAIMKRYLDAEERTDRRYALGAYVSANVWGSTKGPKPTLDDFMLHQYGTKKEKKKNWEQSLATLKQQISSVKK
jgi:hypothetical protein